jgi:tripartite ATP-independent transporter DctP family solute receptor
MKKLVCVALALFMVFGLVACSSSGETVTETASAQASATESASAEVSTSVEPSASAESSGYQGEELTLTCSTADPDKTIVGRGMQKFADLVSEATDGKVKIEVYFNSSLFTMEEQVAATMEGNCDIVASGITNLSDYMPELGMYGAPYLFSSSDKMLEFFNSEEAKPLMEKVVETMNIRPLATDSFGARTLNLNVDRKVTCRDDLKDIKLRMPNNEAWLFLGEALGANPVGIAYADLYMALQTGTCDAQDNPVTTIKDQAYYEVTKSVTLSNHMFSSGWLLINEDKWKSLSPELQQILSDAAQEGFGEFIQEQTLAEAEDAITFLEEKGMVVYELTDEEMASYRQEVLDYFAANGDTSTWDMDLYNVIQGKF